jgi:leucyl aminopeptidase
LTNHSKGEFLNFTIQPSKVNKSKDLAKTISKIIVTNKDSLKKTKLSFSNELQPWQLEEIGNEEKKLITGTRGPVWFMVLDHQNDNSHNGLLNKSDYAKSRELVGSIISDVISYKSKEVIIDFVGCSKEEQLGAIVGVELSLYRYNGSKSLGATTFKTNGKKLADKVIDEAKSIATAINQARHLVNLPPNLLNPVTYANEVKKLYKNSKTIKVNVLDEKKLKKESCNLLLSVGSSSNNPPRIVHLKYRVANSKGKSIALIGKGITFDSGGLDVKSASGMRYMKKDMGGSATILGFSRWLENSGIKKNIDLYLALAENAVSDKSSRPSDVYTARNGMTVEIHNTDAEGRLALADTMDYALEQDPEVIIDVATLTGAGKVALGKDIASLFSNNDKLAQKIQESSQKMGDLCWRMPLFNPYYSALKSDFANVSNSASGHGGAITAALFLEKFVGKTKWAHLDIFGWTTNMRGELVQKGGNGQGVETLIGYFK